jgi:hypothetical protein
MLDLINQPDSPETYTDAALAAVDRVIKDKDEIDGGVSEADRQLFKANGVEYKDDSVDAEIDRLKGSAVLNASLSASGDGRDRIDRRLKFLNSTDEPADSEKPELQASTDVSSGFSESDQTELP